MSGHTYITFLSDYGWSGGYVAACEATMASICPTARVLHISHEIALGDVGDGGAVLARVAPLGPVAVHLAVVDPGVGSDRAAVAVRAARGDFLVGPDNGLLIPAIEALGGVEDAWLLDPRTVRAQASLSPVDPSHTFHGRDVFAPAAALLADGLPPAVFGRPLDSSSLLRPPSRLVEVGSESARVEVAEIDRFGNVALAVGLERFCFQEPCELVVKVEKGSGEGWRCRVVRTFSDLKPGELGILQDSWGHASLTLNGASAAELLGVRLGGVVDLALRAEGEPASPDGPMPVPGDGRTHA
jgi:S-adenosylmethionine hydrolase